MSNADPAKIIFPSTCRFCHGDLSELSIRGRENHEEYCRVVVGVPDVKPRSTEILAKHHAGPVSETVQARNYAPGALQA